MTISCSWSGWLGLLAHRFWPFGACGCTGYSAGDLCHFGVLWLSFLSSLFLGVVVFCLVVLRWWYDDVHMECAFSLWGPQKGSGSSCPATACG